MANHERSLVWVLLGVIAALVFLCFMTVAGVRYGWNSSAPQQMADDVPKLTWAAAP